MAGIINAEKRIKELGLSDLTTDNMLAAKQLGFSDEQLAHLTGTKTDVVRAVREVLGVRPQVKTVDTCAGEFGCNHAVPLRHIREGQCHRVRRGRKATRHDSFRWS